MTSGAGAKRNQSVRKAIALLRAVAADGGSSVSALARTTGMPRATTLRIVQTMEEEGFLVRIGDADRVVLGPHLIRLVRDADVGRVLLDVARQPLRDLSEDLRETVTLSVVASDGDLDLVYQIDAPRQIRPRDWVGQRFPLHASSSGKVLLASLDDDELVIHLRRPLARLTPRTITDPDRLREELEMIREHGYGLTVDELEEGLSGVSAGISDATGALVGIVNVHGLSQRLDDAALRRAGDRLREVVVPLSDALTDRPS